MLFGRSLSSLTTWDLDEVFGYRTPKLVWIRDRHIGYIYYSIVSSLLLWIVGYQILWSNQHFVRKDVDGLVRMFHSHPTEGNCDPALASCRSSFRSSKTLPYCEDYEGLEKYSKRAPCLRKNKISMTPDGIKDNRLFIPTAVEVITERQTTCHHDPLNGHTCSDDYRPLAGFDCLAGEYMCKKRGNETNQFYYVADVRNVLIRFTSSYERDNVRGTSLMHRAHLGVCPSQLRSERRLRTWEERSRLAAQSWCGRGDVEMQLIPCSPSVNCSELRSTGVDSQTSIKDWLLRRAGFSGAKHDIEQWLFHRATPSPTPSPRLADDSWPMPPGMAAAARTPTAAPRPDSDEEGVPVQGRALVQRMRRRLGAAAPAAPGEEKQPVPAPTAPPSGRHHEAEAPPKSGPPPPEAPDDMQVFSDGWGDVFTLGKLLELAGVDLDNDYNMDGWTTRQAGTALEVSVVYNNLYPFWSSLGYQPVMYNYEVKELMLPYLNLHKLAEVQPKDYPHTRRYEIQHGVMIRFKVGGAFGFFNVIFFCVMLATAVASIAMASTITDFAVLYLHPRHHNFFHLKYEVSADASDMWKCSVCGYMNELEDVKCKGVPKWMGPRETPECGTPRPLVAAGVHRARAESRVVRMMARQQLTRALTSSNESSGTGEEEAAAAGAEEPEAAASSTAPSKTAGARRPARRHTMPFVISAGARTSSCSEESQKQPAPTPHPRSAARRLRTSTSCLMKKSSPRRRLVRAKTLAVSFQDREDLQRGSSDDSERPSSSSSQEEEQEEAVGQPAGSGQPTSKAPPAAS